MDVSKTDERRSVIVDRLADHVLAHGLVSASLRPLAKAAGTSDRMLLYYFADKSELLAATLQRIAERSPATTEELAAIVGTMTAVTLAPEVLAVLVGFAGSNPQ